jgi:hypothetical protein
MGKTLRLLVGQGSNGNAAYEEVLVEPVGPAQYRLLQSPGLALGIAADDVFSRSSDGNFKVLSRGGNVCIQIFADDVNTIEKAATQGFKEMGGRLDGRSARQLVYTVPFDVGFPRMEGVLEAVKARFPEAEWYYGNVYDPEDGVTPLNWWK